MSRNNSQNEYDPPRGQQQQQQYNDPYQEPYYNDQRAPVQYHETPQAPLRQASHQYSVTRPLVSPEANYRTGGGVYGQGGYGESSQSLQNQQQNGAHDPYYEHDQSFSNDNNGYNNGTWDERSTHSHSALNMEKEGYYPSHEYAEPVPSLPYGHPAYPPAQNSPGMIYSPYGQQQPRFGDPNEYNLQREKFMNRRSVRQVELTDGHLVLECPVPTAILQFNQYAGEDMTEESGKMRYTAVTEDPDEFTRSRYSLRPVLYGRQTELVICMTMYNEDEILFERTFTSVIKNIQHLQSRTKSKTWGEGSWKKIVVVIVSDGRGKINPRTLKMLGLYGAYQDGIAKDTVDGKDVAAHLFEYTTQVVVDSKGTVSGGIAPVQILFCLKEQNKKKLNSHRWLFNAFCPQLRPNVVILLDVGTKPSGNSIYLLWKAFDNHKGVGGACGEITVDTGRYCSNLFNPLVAAQNFEYKMSNILDKPLESVFGMISVLPGGEQPFPTSGVVRDLKITDPHTPPAFSAYRYRALLDGPDGRGPLQTYFLGEKMHEPGAVASLSQNRILCFEIVCKKKEAWTLRYVKAAKASTDVPNTIPEFISQRRRWMNGSFFAATHATGHYFRIWTSGQGFMRKIFLSFLFLYNLIQLVFQFIGLSSFYLAFFFICTSATSGPAGTDPFGGYGSDVISVCKSLYIATLGVTIVAALGNKPAGSKWWYVAVFTMFAALFVIALYCTAWTIYLSVPHTAAGWNDFGALLRQAGFRDIVISIGATYGLYIVASLVHYEPWHLLTSLFQYLMFLPSYVSVLTIYSFANLHDLAWGTSKPQDRIASLSSILTFPTPSTEGSTTVKDLGGATKKKTADGKELVEINLVSAPDDVNALWLNMKKEMETPFVEVHQKRDADSKKTDSYANIRTNTLLTYLGVNMIIVVFFTSSFWTNFLKAQAGSTGPVVNYYLVGIFWSVAVLSAIRFLGSALYIVFMFLGL